MAGLALSSLVRRTASVLLIALICQRCWAESENEEEEQEKLIRKDTSDWIYVWEILLVIVLSICFEKGQDKLCELFETLGRQGDSLTMMMNCLTNEIMILGFIGLCVYCATKTDLALDLARQIYPSSMKLTEEDDPLAETFETVHMIIFCVMVCFISQVSLLMYKAVFLETQKWKIWEHVRVGKMEAKSIISARASASGTFSLSAAASTVRKTAQSAAYNTIELGRGQFTEPTDQGLTIFDMLKAAGYCNESCTEFKDVRIELNPFKRMFSRGGVLDLLQWRLIRHHFMFPNSSGDSSMVQEGQQTYKPAEPYLFQFYMYLDMKMGEAFVELIEVDVITWSLMGIVAMFLPWVYSLGSYWFTTVAAICSWSIFGCMFFFGVHIHDVYGMLTPELSEPTVQNYLDSMKGTSGSALKRQHRRQQQAKKDGQTPRNGSDSARSAQEGSGDIGNDVHAPLLPNAAKVTFSEPEVEKKQPNIAEERFSQRGIQKRTTKRTAAFSATRPWYLLQLQRLNLIQLEKAAPNEHDSMFFFHEASPGIYMHFIGDLLFFQSVVTSMYLVLWCVCDVHWGIFQTAMAIFGICGPLLNLFWLIPKIVGKTVMLFSIEHMKDKRVIEDVIFDTKKHQLLESLKLFEISRMEGKVERIIQDNDSQFGLTDETKKKYEDIFKMEFSEKKKKDIKHMFELFDEDGSGSISKDEMLAVFSSMHADASSGVVQCADKLWDLVDADGSGNVEWEEFRVLMAMVLYKDEATRVQDDEALFRKFDEDGGADGNGFVSITNLASGFERLGVELDAESVASLVGLVFKKGKQNLDQNDFVFFMNSLEEMSEKAL